MWPDFAKETRRYPILLGAASNTVAFRIVEAPRQRTTVLFSQHRKPLKLIPKYYSLELSTLNAPTPTDKVYPCKHLHTQITNPLPINPSKLQCPLYDRYTETAI